MKFYFPSLKCVNERQYFAIKLLLLSYCYSFSNQKTSAAFSKLKSITFTAYFQFIKNTSYTVPKPPFPNILFYYNEAFIIYYSKVYQALSDLKLGQSNVLLY